MRTLVVTKNILDPIATQVRALLRKLVDGQGPVAIAYDDLGKSPLPDQSDLAVVIVPADVDGASEEGTPYIPAHGMQRIVFTPRPAGLRFYHTHVRAGGNLAAGFASDGGPATAAQLISPRGLAFDSKGNLKLSVCRTSPGRLCARQPGCPDGCRTCGRRDTRAPRHAPDRPSPASGPPSAPSP